MLFVVFEKTILKSESGETEVSPPPDGLQQLIKKKALEIAVKNTFIMFLQFIQMELRSN
jgi:hypothetical protein